MFDEHEEMNALERDVLLASSGELPWWRKPVLTWRLMRSARARELAATLRSLDDSLASSHIATRRRWKLALGPALALPVVAALLWLVWPKPQVNSDSPALDELALIEPPAVIVPPANVDAEEELESPLPAPSHVALARLEIASSRVGRVASGWSGAEPTALDWSPVPELNLVPETLEVR